MFPYTNEMWNFGGDRIFDSYAYDVNGTFVNFYNFDFRTTLNKSVMDDRLTRGGPQARSPENGTWSLNLGSDSRKSYNVNANFQHSWNEFAGNGSTFTVDDPDFNFRSLLGNAVMRWEYRPGSTLFLVWQQRRTDVEPMGGFDFSRDYRGLLNQAPENVFAVKATYWIGL